MLPPLSRGASGWLRFVVPPLMLFMLALRIVCLIYPVNDVYVEVGERRIDLLEFTFGQMVFDFWEAGAWLISTLISCSSMIPLVKIVTLINIWLFPLPMSEKTRGVALLVLDFLGHLAFTDIVFMAHVVINLSADVVIGTDLATVRLRADPEIGIFCGVPANIGSMILGQYMLHHHHATTAMVLYEKAKVQLLPSAEEPMLSEKSAPSPLERRGTSLVDRTDYGKTGKSIQFLTIWSTGVLGVLFAVSYAFSFTQTLCTYDFGGVAGFFLSDPVELSVYTVISDFGALTANKAGANFLAAVLFVSLLLAPVVNTVFCILLWVLPCERPAQETLIVLIKRSLAWCGIDVILLATFAASLEMNQVAIFAIDHELPFLCDQFFPGLGAQCIRLEGEMGPAGAWLLCALLLHWAFNAKTLWHSSQLLVE